MTSVLHISTKDVGGGGWIATYRAHQGMVRTGIDSRIAVQLKLTKDPRVLEMAPPDIPAWRRLPQIAQDVLQKRAMARFLATRRPDLEYFSHARALGRDWLTGQIPEADIINVHWIAEFMDWERFIGRLPVDQPLVITLQDMNNFTGGCHYTLGCDGFTRACGACPQVQSTRDADLSRHVFRAKERALARRRPEITHVVATSRWMAAEVGRSALLGRFDSTVIGNAVDTQVFRPQPRAEARAMFDLPQDRPIVLFVANSVTNPRKGPDLLEAALGGLAPDLDPLLVTVGATPGTIPGARHLGRIDDEARLSWVFSAADLFVHPARAEAFGLVLIESLACGTPVVAFGVGGPLDILSEATGHLAPPESVAGLREGMERLLRLPAEAQAQMAKACRARAMDFDLGVAGDAYAALYEALMAARPARPWAQAPA